MAETMEKVWHMISSTWEKNNKTGNYLFGEKIVLNIVEESKSIWQGFLWL